MSMDFLCSTYKYNKENYKNCPIFEDGCQFTPSFIQGCKQGRAMVGCHKCIETKPMIVLTCDSCAEKDSHEKVDEFKKLGWLFVRGNQDKSSKQYCPNCANTKNTNLE